MSKTRLVQSKQEPIQSMKADSHEHEQLEFSLKRQERRKILLEINLLALQLLKGEICRQKRTR